MYEHLIHTKHHGIIFFVDPLSILTAGNEVLIPGAVINTGSLSLSCLGTTGNRDLRWEAMNITNLDNGEISLEEASAFQGFDVTYFINTDLLTLNRSYIMLSSAPLVPLVMGYISCTSAQSNRSVEVFITPTNPLWRLLSPLMDITPMGAEVTLTIQHADASVGYQNQGSGFVYSLRFLPCVATQPDEMLTGGNTNQFNNTLEYTFRARLNDDSGEYKWNGMV